MMNSPVNILLVDDDVRNLEVLESILESPDYHLVRAQTPDDALMALIQNDIAAMVLDIQMPQMTGLELAHLIKQRKRTQHIPIIFLTAYFQEDKDVLEGYGVGAVDYLTKPANPQILRSKIAAFVELFRKTRAVTEINRVLATEILQRQTAEEALRQLNNKLEARVQQRTLDLTQAIENLRQSERKLLVAKDQMAITNEDLERRVQARTFELREINGQLEELVHTIAHDLRAPLRTMEACSTMLLDEYGDGLETLGREYAGRINKSAQFMDKLILDLLEYGRTSRAEMELGTVEVGRMWELAVFQHQHQIHHKNAVVEIKTSLPCVRAHEVTLSQTLANFLSNSLRFMADGVRPHICIGAEKNGKLVRLWVEDNGIGIAPEHHERIFRVFERLNGASYGGTGIGLAIARKGVERMNGRVGVESDLGTGSRFWIELPVSEELMTNVTPMIRSGQTRLPVTESFNFNGART